MNTGFALLFASALLLTTAAAVAPSTPLPEECVTDLVAFSPCFSYVSAPASRVRNRLTARCCNAVLGAFGTGGSNCYCHLVKQPLLFGFPLNRSRIASLPALCSKYANASSAAIANLDSSLESICAALPPVPSSHDPLGAPRSYDSDYDNDTSAAMSPPTESVQAPEVSARRTPKRPPKAPPAPPKSPPPKSGRSPPGPPTAGPPPAPAFEYIADCSMAAELGPMKTWFLQVAAALPLLVSSLI